MDLHHLILFSHIAAMTGLFSALAIEGTTLRFLRRATSYEQARGWIDVWSVLPTIGAPSLLIALASGIYLATSLGLWDFGWTRIAIPTLVIVAIAGGITASYRKRVRTTVGTNIGPLPDDLRKHLRRPLESSSWSLRAALLAGLVFEMTTKPDGALLIMTGFALVGIVGALGFRFVGALENAQAPDR